MTVETENRVRNLIAQELGADLTTYPNARLMQDLCVDSLDMIELEMAIEDEFGIEITDEEWLKVVTVSDVSELVTRKTTH